MCRRGDRYWRGLCWRNWGERSEEEQLEPESKICVATP
jgi:hypothetical protein